MKGLGVRIPGIDMLLANFLNMIRLVVRGAEKDTTRVQQFAKGEVNHQ